MIAATTQWDWNAFGPALFGALVGGAAAFLAAWFALHHETKRRRDDRLRDVRAEMVKELGPALRKGADAKRGWHGIWRRDAFSDVDDVLRLAYAATSADRLLVNQAIEAIDQFIRANIAVRDLGVLDKTTAQYVFPEAEEQAATKAADELVEALQDLDTHLRTALDDSD